MSSKRGLLGRADCEVALVAEKGPVDRLSGSVRIGDLNMRTICSGRRGLAGILTGLAVVCFGWALQHGAAQAQIKQAAADLYPVGMTQDPVGMTQVEFVDPAEGGRPLN